MNGEKPVFSKEGKHQRPQLVLGLLVSEGGYPLANDVFPGNPFEGHTLVGVLERFKKTHKLEQLVIVANAGMLSNANLEQLQAKGYEFIVGARVKNESNPIKKTNRLAAASKSNLQRPSRLPERE